MATIASGANQQIVIPIGISLYVTSTDNARVNVLYGPNWNTIAQNIRVKFGDGPVKIGPFSQLTKIDIMATSGSADYNYGNLVTVLSASRATVPSDSGQETIANATASNFTLTVAANTITKPTFIQQESTGTITLVAGAGVTFIGSSLATDKAGSLLSILPTTTLNTFIIVKGGL
jgi:hypothetical protein